MSKEVTPQDVLDYFGVKFDSIQKSLYYFFWNHWNEEDAIGFVQMYSKRYMVEDVIIGDKKYVDNLNTRYLQKEIRVWEKSIDTKDAFKMAWIRFWKKRACGGTGRRCGFKSRCPKGRAGSNPAMPTI